MEQNHRKDSDDSRRSTNGVTKDVAALLPQVAFDIGHHDVLSRKRGNPTRDRIVRRTAHPQSANARRQSG